MALRAPRTSLTVGHCGNSGGLRHRLNLSLRGPRNDDRSRERSINFALRETGIFRPSKAGAIVGSVHRGPCADKQRVRGRTAPPVPTTSVVPRIRCADLRCTQVLEAHFAPNGQSVRSQPLPQDKVGRIKSSTRQWPERSEGQAAVRNPTRRLGACPDTRASGRQLFHRTA
jgi:hypothetical protein